MTKSNAQAVYGRPPGELVDVPTGSLQTSPRIPGATMLGDIAPASLDRLTIYAPESTFERQYVLAQALAAVKPGGSMVVLAPKNKGGARLANELEAFGCDVDTAHRRHHKIAVCQRPAEIIGVDEALEKGAPRYDRGLGFWTQPGLFSWNRIDPGSALLLRHLPPLEGVGADLGCGYGVLARAVLGAGACRRLTLIDIDRRALDIAVRNVALEIDAPEVVATVWADIRSFEKRPFALDFVVMNPPFHDSGAEDRALGRAFIEQAAAMLRPAGVLWMTANRHLPYEDVLKQAFAAVEPIAQEQGYKIYKAQK